MPRANNFDAIRLFAALSVLFSHSFLIAEGTQENEPFLKLTGNQCILGLLGVFVFFCISGFLVTQSYISTASAPRFVVKRGLRIFPGLIVSILLCALVIGPAVTELTFVDYFSDPDLYWFIAHNVLLSLGNHPLPGSQFSGTSVGTVVNGSLWTLRYEVMMYAMILALGAVRLLRLSVSILLLALGLLAIYFEQDLDWLGDIGEWLWMLSFFASGMCLYFLRERGLLCWQLALCSGFGLIAITLSHHLILLFAVFGGFLTIYFALKHTPRLDNLSRFGDLSYGVYIYAWPIGQCLMYGYGGAAAWWQVFLGSLAICLPLAWLSWICIERPALRIARQPPRQTDSLQAGMISVRPVVSRTR